MSLQKLVKSFRSSRPEIALQRGCSLVNLLHIFRTTFRKDTSGRLLLIFATQCSFTDQSKQKIANKKNQECPQQLLVNCIILVREPYNCYDS